MGDQLSLELVYDKPKWEIEQDNLRLLGERLKLRLVEHLPEAATKVQEIAIGLAPKRTGHLADSIGTRVNLAEFLAGVGVRTEPPPYGTAQEWASYAGAVIKGWKREKPIHPKFKKAIWWADLEHPVRKVTKPAGHAATPFLTDALAWSDYQVERVFQRAVNDMLEEATV